MTIDVTEWTKNYITNFVDTYKHCQFVRGQTEMRIQYMLIDPPPTRREFFFFCYVSPPRGGPKDGSRTAVTSMMELFVIIVNGWKPLTIITKCSILDVAAFLYSTLGPL